MSLDLRSPLAPQNAPGDRAPASRGRITARAILLALAIIPFQMHWIGLVEGVWHGLHMTCLSLPMAPLFLLLVLRVANLGLQRLWPRAVLRQAELLTIFTMLALSAFLCGHDRLINLMGTVAYAHRFATPENRWEELFFAYLPEWFVVKDREAAFHYYAGGSSCTLYWRHWVKPAIGWSAFTGVVVATLLCLNVVMRKRWTEAERLSYPIIQIPLAMTDPRFPFWRSAPLWIGFGLAGGVDLLNGIAYLYPSVPSLPYYGAAMDLKPYLVDHPWNAIDYLRADFYPFMLGIAYFLPMDIIFSTWFFYLVGRLQMVWGGATGLRELLPRYPYFGMQAAGAVLVIALVALWEARGYLRQVWRRAIGMKSSLDDRDEAMSYRAALLGAAIGFVLLCWFGMQIGIAPQSVALYFALYLLIAMAIARLRADSGAPVHGLVNVNPHDVLVTHFGTVGESPRHLTGMALCVWLTQLNRAHPMPQQLEALKIAQVLRQSQRAMAVAMMAAAVLTIALYFVIFPPLMYRHGAAVAEELKWAGGRAFGAAGLTGWLESPRPPDGPGIGFFAGGAGLALAMAMMRARFVWWPFHPMGYAIGTGWTAQQWWVSLIVCSLVKGVIVHYGGVRGFQRAAPFFIGLVLGQFVVLCLWSLIAVISEQPMYWPFT